ncbi:biotin transporter BioY [Thermococcus profundus]|uniref:Biotin transporter BioY n=1 Tax=Thermococcus profundus TaxID=49899 RepID=A0A2Z2MCJ1_THEPR|nr:biotin transporter BioY [Thermococcus profundus]ASJ02412.1 biotin transporter BioY [Thermococcus profundus]
MDVEDISYASVFGALTALGAWISVPLGEVPVTLQVLFVLLSGFLLGAKRGFLSQITYLLAGAVGLPVFAKFSGGPAVIYGPTGGYLMAFPIAAAVAGLAYESRGLLRHVALGLLALGVIYLLGWARLTLLLDSPERAFEVGVLPFVAVDVVKTLLAGFLALSVKRRGNLVGVPA